MVQAQQWLNANYPLETRENFKYLDIKGSNNFKLEGALSLKGFTNLERLDCNENQITNLDVEDCLKLKIINCFTNQLTNLDLTSLERLEELNCNNNKLTKISLNKVNQLRLLRCSRNYLTNLDFLSSLNPKTLVDLSVSSNDFSSQDLKAFSQFTNLEYLFFGNSDKQKINNNCYNRFFGSLKPLKNLTKLKELSLHNTDIENGLEYLSPTIEEIYASCHERPASKVKKIAKELEADHRFFFGNNSSIYKGHDYRYKKKWSEFHSDFAPELQRKWEDYHFDYEQMKKWINVGLTPHKADYAWWLKFTKDKEADDLVGNKEELEQLEKEFMDSWLSDEVIKQIKGLWRWWLTNDQKEMIKQLIPNEKLRNRYLDHGLCENCQQPYAGSSSERSKVNTTGNFVGEVSASLHKLKNNVNKICPNCEAKSLQQYFPTWTSGDSQIDKLIQWHQLNSTRISESLVWIPSRQLANVNHIANGGFGKVYKATWNKETDRPCEVVLKVLGDSHETNLNFIKETANYKLTSSPSVVGCFGISQDPETGNYAIVLKCASGGNLRDYIKKNHNELRLSDKFNKFMSIIQGLANIHEQGLIHRDLHLGNILVDNIKFGNCQIADLGLSKAINEDSDGKVYGLLPYVAPEVLCGQEYSQASDIYSFGMLMYEAILENPAYHDIPYNNYNNYLAKKICQELLRPRLEDITAPQPLKDIISRCWDADPSKRPTAGELEKLLFGLDRNLRFQWQAIFQSKNELKNNSNAFKNYFQSSHNSRLMSFSNFSGLQNSSSSQWQTATLLEQIRRIEPEINLIKAKLNQEQLELVEELIVLNKQLKKNKNDEIARSRFNELDEKLLEEEILSEEKANELLQLCDKLFELEEQQTKIETEEQRAQVEVPT